MKCGHICLWKSGVLRHKALCSISFCLPVTNSWGENLCLAEWDDWKAFDTNRCSLGYSGCLFFFLIIQSLSRVWIFAIPWTAEYQASLSITNTQNLLKLMSIESVMPSNSLILCGPLLLPSIFPTSGSFLKRVLCMRWTKYWSFSYSISPSIEYSGLISFRIDWFDLLAF